MGITIKQSVYEPIEPGIYTGKIATIEQVDGVYGEQLKFTFLLDPFGDYEAGKQLTAWTSMKFSQKSKLYTWTMALLGKLTPDYDFDSDDLLGKPCQVVVGNKFTPDGNLFDFVESIKPLTQKRNSQPLGMGVSASMTQ